MQEITNADRANWALAALSGFVAETRVDTAREAIGDLIADLLHLGRGRGYDTLSLIDRAHRMMMEELAEDPEGDMALVQRAFASLLEVEGLP